MNASLLFYLARKKDLSIDKSFLAKFALWRVECADAR